MRERALVVAAVLVACGGPHSSVPASSAYDPEPIVVAGAFPPDRGPDGNSVILRAPRGLIIVAATGRHPAHQDKLLAFARQAGAPITAIVNTHWHLDHSGGNAALRAVYPGAEIIATRAVESALVGFFPNGRAQGDALIASGKATRRASTSTPRTTSPRSCARCRRTNGSVTRCARSDGARSAGSARRRTGDLSHIADFACATSRHMVFACAASQMHKGPIARRSRMASRLLRATSGRSPRPRTKRPDPVDTVRASHLTGPGTDGWHPRR
jgi:hypothetical protein